MSDTTNGSIGENAVSFDIGARGDGALPFNGILDEVKIFNKSRSVSQVKELFSCRTPNNSSRIWTMNTNCTVTSESDNSNLTMKATDGTYIANNPEIHLEKAVASGGKIVATNGGKIIAGT